MKRFSIIDLGVVRAVDSPGSRQPIGSRSR
jgi:hypothetical protein